MGIDGKSLFRFMFGLVDIGIGCCVDNDFGLKTLNHGIYGGAVGNVQSFGVGEDDFPILRCAFAQTLT